MKCNFDSIGFVIGSFVLLGVPQSISLVSTFELFTSIYSLDSNITLLADRDELEQAPSHDSLQSIDAEIDYPIVAADTWMTEKGVPWSELVMIRSEHQDDYLAVLDRFYDAESSPNHPGISSLWSRQQLQVYGYGQCIYCEVEHPAYPVSAASLKVGDRVFHLQGGDSSFVISEEVAWALKNAPPYEVWLRIAIAGGSNYTTRPIGPNTIAAWQTLYQDAEPVEVAALPEAPTTQVSRLPDNLPADLPVIDESTWRQQSGVPWSQPLIVRDDFNGDYLAVLDRDYSSSGFFSRTTSGILTNWSADQLAVHAYEEEESYLMSYSCWSVRQLVLQIGQQTFYLKGENNIFRISDDLASVLASQPLETPRLSYPQSNGEVITREIGPGTVEAWSVIYGTAEVE
ncbi:MAG: hypothetical protein F6K42_18150 [Leptolyngbya sp. SIO1D8]|nr:hypothetical protein [Leptolyngbya sp. SIO1D8]